MKPLAEFCLGAGWAVQGSDLKDSKTLQRLAEQGANCFVGQRAENLGAAKTVVYSSAIQEDNAELIAAKKAENRTVWHRSELLAFLISQKRSITVAGTHGKTTTTALIFHMLEKLGLQASALCGGVMLGVQSSGHFGQGEYLVAEADESDGTLIRYQPEIAVLTNIDADHLDFFGDESTQHKLFKSYLDQVDQDGRIVVGWDNAVCRSLAQEYGDRRLAYGTWIGSDIRGIPVNKESHEQTFNAVVERDSVPVRLPLIGHHNMQNALAALAVARALELDIKKAAEALSSFAGVKRRLNLVAQKPGFKLYDDYAHNPGKIRAVLEGLRAAFAFSKIHVIFQPHRYSRLRSNLSLFAEAFYQADYVYVSPICAAGEPIDPRITQESLAAMIGRESNTTAKPFTESTEMIQWMESHPFQEDCIVVTVGAGDVEPYAEAIQEHFQLEKI